MKHLLLILLAACSIFAQSVAMTQTTLVLPMDGNQRNLNVADATGISAPGLFGQNRTYLYVDEELMSVQSVVGTGIVVQRGVNGTVATPHNAAAVVYVGPGNQFSSSTPTGACTNADWPVTPRIVPVAGQKYTCTSGVWTLVGSGGGGGGGAGATSQLTDFAAGGVGSSALAITCATGLCNAATGDTVTSFAGLSASCTLASGSYTAYAYIDQPSAALVVGASTAPTCTGATAAGSITAYPGGALPLWRVAVVSGVIAGLTDDRAAYGVGKRVLVTGVGAPTRTETAAAVTLDFSASGGGSPGGSGSELQYRAGASTFGGIANTLVESNALRWNTVTPVTGGLVRFGTAASTYTSSLLHFRVPGSTADVLLVESSAGTTLSNTPRLGIGLNGLAVPILAWRDAAGNTSNWDMNGILFGSNLNVKGFVGSQFGALELRPASGNGIQINTTGTKPTCAVGIRGHLFYTASGAGVADSVEVCTKDAADAYAWRALY